MNRKGTVKKVTIKEIIVLVLVVFTALTGISFTQNVDNLDYMWVFSFASKIANGYVPYLDFNMVVTPLSPQITACILNIFGNTMMTSTFVGIIYGVIIFLMQYLILRKLNITKKVSALVVLISFMLMCNCIVDSYNILALMLVHILLFMEICKIRYEKYLHLGGKRKYIFKNVGEYTTIYNIITGVLLGLTILAKQNIGAVAILAVTVYYFSKCIYKELKFTQAFGQLTIKAIFCIIPILIEAVYLYFAGALYNFIDYTILGLIQFGQKVNSSLITAMLYPSSLGGDTLINWIRNLGMIFSIVFLCIMTSLKAKGKIRIKNRFDKNVMVLSLTFILIGIFISIPLANIYHITLTATLIQFLFVLNILLTPALSRWIDKAISKITYYLIIFIPLILGIGYMCIYFIAIDKSQIEPFENMYIPKENEATINSVVKYIYDYEKENNHPLYVITSNGVKFSLAMKRNNGIFDLPQYGNLGKGDYMNVINTLDSMSGFSVMIYSDEKYLFWQEPKQISEYIKQNYEYVDSFDIYDIYYKGI